MTAEPVSSYRCRLTIDHSRVRNTDQQNFPVLVRLCYPALRNTTAGGHVKGTDGPQAGTLYRVRLGVKGKPPFRSKINV